MASNPLYIFSFCGENSSYRKSKSTIVKTHRGSKPPSRSCRPLFCRCLFHLHLHQQQVGITICCLSRIKINSLEFMEMRSFDLDNIVEPLGFCEQFDAFLLEDACNEEHGNRERFSNFGPTSQLDVGIKFSSETKQTRFASRSTTGSWVATPSSVITGAVMMSITVFDMYYLKLLALSPVILLFATKGKMAGAPPGTSMMIMKEIGIAAVLGFFCGGIWKYTYHSDLKRRTKSFYNMLDKDEITVVVSED
ncbi:hypothetical protein Ccrd_026877 [Cynara cardunculus var. scolymus]|uniref:Uncharacterized protein n=1 Tax=Cynara cardunculus var. scolymus TaxID=59895 RepID=A0A124SAS5_CYNCS|nr:hypothetical protein Ccrd_026877 [Cynara cardunculus var. scolymus]